MHLLQEDTDIMEHYRLNDPSFLRDPSQMLEKMRADGSITRVKVPLIGMCWITTTDATARELLKDEANFSRNPANAGGRDISRYYWFLPRFMRPISRNILGLDGEEHRRIRNSVEKSFSRLYIDELRPEIRQIADNLIDRFDPSKPIDVIQDYARPLPLAVICALLGIKRSLRTELARAIAPISGPTGTLMLLRALPGLHKALKLLRAEIDAIRQTPREGLLSELIHNQTSSLGDDEILSLAFVLVVAGHETTLHLISNSIFSLSDGVTALPENMDQAVEEFMRFFSPVMMTKPLFVRKDVEFHGQSLKQSDKVLALLIGANHDPYRFNAPDEQQLNRRPNAHIGFGFGPHVCLGMQLARAETQIALEQLFKRYPDLRRTPKDAPPDYAQSFGMRGLKSLKLRLRP